MYDVKRAACFYQLIRYSYGSSCTSYGSQPFDIRRTFRPRLHALGGKQGGLAGTSGGDNKDFDGTHTAVCMPEMGCLLFYVDPPYSKTGGTCTEAVVCRAGDDHVRLALTMLLGEFRENRLFFL